MSTTVTSPGTLIPRCCTLDGFVSETSWSEGVDVRAVEPLDVILVRTCNSVYRLIPLRHGATDVLVQGGQFFQEPTTAQIAGSSFGGSFLKMAWVLAGLHLEIHAGGEHIVTTRVREILIQPASPDEL